MPRSPASSSSAGNPARVHPPALLVYLDAVARAGSIRKAADSLHVASTALNRRILNLEDELGTPIFERLTHGVRLTAAGEIFMAYVRSSLGELTSAVSQIEQLRGLVRGQVQIGAAESVTSDLLPAAMAQFQQRHPGVRFHVRSGGTEAVVKHLLADTVDLMLVHEPPQHDALHVLADLPQPLHALVRQDHPLASRSSIRLADCAPYPVTLGEETFAGRRLVDKVLTATRLKLNVTLVASSIQSMAAYARQTGAIAFQFEIGTRHEVHNGGLVSLPLTDRSLARARLVLAARKDRALPIAALRFAEVLRAQLAGAG